MKQSGTDVGVVSSSPLHDEEVSLAEYLAVLWKHRRALLGITLLAGLITLVVSWNRAPVYLASSKLMVSQSKIGDQANLTLSVGTYRAMVNNQTLVRQVMNELRLTDPPHGISVSRMLQQHLQVDVLPDTNLIEVSTRLSDPALAARFANRLSECAVEASRQASQQDIITARDTIKFQLDESRNRLAQAEKQLESYRKDAQLDALKKDVAAMLDERAKLLPLLVEIEAERARVKQTIEELARQEKVRDVRRSVNPATVLNPPGQTDRQELKLRDDVLNPFVNPVYEVLEQQLSASRTRLSGLEKAHAEIVRMTDRGQVGATKLNELYAKEAEIERLQTEQTLSKQVYLDVSNRYEQSRIQVASRSAQLQVIDQAVPPEVPVSPRAVRDTVLAAVLAGVIASILLLLTAVGRRELRPLR